jgi:hypothetical protein
MKKRPQLMKRIATPLVRHVLDHYRQELLSASDAAQELQLSRSRFYELYSEYDAHPHPSPSIT